MAVKFKFVAKATDTLRTALLAAPELTVRFVRQELIRFSKRFKKKFIQDRMKGRPGINAPRMSQGKNVAAWVDGKTIGTLTAHAKIGRILKVHEEGRTIQARNGGYLFIRKGNKIVAKVREVRIPARLGFRDTWNAMIPDARARIKRAMERAVKVARERATKKVINLAG